MVSTFNNCKVFVGNKQVGKRGKVGDRQGMLYINLPAEEIGKMYQFILIKLETSIPPEAKA